jgi:hypothetical protein
MGGSLRGILCFLATLSEDVDRAQLLDLPGHHVLYPWLSCLPWLFFNSCCTAPCSEEGFRLSNQNNCCRASLAHEDRCQVLLHGKGNSVIGLSRSIIYGRCSEAEEVRDPGPHSRKRRQSGASSIGQASFHIYHSYFLLFSFLQLFYTPELLQETPNLVPRPKSPDRASRHCSASASNSSLPPLPSTSALSALT